MKNLFLLSLLIFLVACEPIPEVKISGGNPPTFTISRTKPAYFEICCEKEFEPQNDRNNLWHINMNSDTKFPLEIVYGVIPEGSNQGFPKNNMPVSSLVEGRKYQYEAMGSWGAKIGCFQIQDGKAVAVECDNPNPSLHITLKEGDSLPSFKVDGLDRVYSFSIYEYAKSIEDGWFIKPDIEHQPKLPVNITYGTFPEGYTQTIPMDHKKPQTLKPGIKYIYSGLRTYATL